MTKNIVEIPVKKISSAEEFENVKAYSSTGQIRCGTLNGTSYDEKNTRASGNRENDTSLTLCPNFSQTRNSD